METRIYTERKSYVKYDDNHYLLYLNETEIPNYIPEVRDNEPAPAPCLAYQYEGTEVDGGTLIEAAEANYETFVNGLIRNNYTQSEVEAIQSNMIVSMTDTENERALEFQQEWKSYQEYRNMCKSNAKIVLGL